MIKIYKPKLWLALVDLLVIAGNVLFVFLFLPLTSNDPFRKYAIPLAVFTVFWLIVSLLLNRYRPLMKQGFFKSISSLALTSIISFVVLGGYIYFKPESGYSEYVLATILIGVFLGIYLFIFFFNAFKYATQYETPILGESEKRAQKTKIESVPINPKAAAKRKSRTAEYSGEKVLAFLEKNIDLYSTSTFVMTTPDGLNDATNEYSTTVQLRSLNSIRGINKMFVYMNDSLEENGLLVCCYKSKATTKQNIFKKYPRGVADVFYFIHFVVHRLLPKLFLTDRLYLDFTEGRRRTLSKTEVLGRLNYCGFKIDRVAKINDMHYAMARKVSTPEGVTPRRYGPLIKLKRFGKNGKLFNVYKFRTMHPYAEFLQQYVYEQSSLAEGGKFRRDIRVTTTGRIMRKYWIDELPMLYNLLKRDMKMVGVRPLSMQYFNLYTKKLQEKRIRHKPGLLPPFYADMPKTLEEIEESELRYLQDCEDKGTYRTDTRYFFLILRNILFRKARSA